MYLPSFTGATGVAQLRAARRAIDYPVVVDNDYEVESAFANHYWPPLYFADAEGVIRDYDFRPRTLQEFERHPAAALGRVLAFLAWRTRPESSG